MAKAAFNTLLVRTLSGVVLFLVVTGCTLLSPYTFGLLAAVICGGGMWEFYSLARKTGVSPQRWAGVVVGVAGVAVATLATSVQGSFLPAVAALLLAMFYALFAAQLYRRSETPIADIATTIAGIIYVALPMSLLVLATSHPATQALSDGTLQGGILGGGSQYYSPAIALAVIYTVWVNDVGAYLVGVTIGRHRLFERISPKKSWEGFFGGLILSLGFGALCAVLLAGDGQPAYAFWMGLAAVIVVSGVLGDLVESMFKRSAGVKDSGAIMPGHGGWLDRFDALIYASPFIFLYFIIFA